MGFQLGPVNNFFVIHLHLCYMCVTEIISVKYYFSREPASLVKPMKSKKLTETEENELNEKLVAVKPTAVRHLFLIRHGQYNLEGKQDSERYLTELGLYYGFCFFD